MSRKDEDRILHGLHYYRESIDAEFAVTSEEILWVAAHSFADGAGWLKHGSLQRVDCTGIPDDLMAKLLNSKYELPLRYLHYRRLIKFTPAGADAAKISVTFAGADRAMRLHTRLGRLEVWYEDHKNGFLGLLITVAVACATALCTVALVGRLHR